MSDTMTLSHRITHAFQLDNSLIETLYALKSTVYALSVL